MVMMRSAGSASAARARNRVVLPASVPPETIMFSRARTAARRKRTKSSVSESARSERVEMCIRDRSYELGLHELAHRHPDCVAWETREANTEGQGAVSMDYLVQRANRHDADRVIVGEVLGDEIVRCV